LQEGVMTARDYTQAYSPLNAEVVLDPLMREALGAVIRLGGSPIQAGWAMIGWTLDDLLARGCDAGLLAADLRGVAADLAAQSGHRSAA
jgi:hypothetical protein